MMPTSSWARLTLCPQGRNPMSRVSLETSMPTNTSVFSFIPSLEMRAHGPQQPFGLFGDTVRRPTLSHGLAVPRAGRAAAPNRWIAVESVDRSPTATRGHGDEKRRGSPPQPIASQAPPLIILSLQAIKATYKGRSWDPPMLMNGGCARNPVTRQVTRSESGFRTGLVPIVLIELLHPLQSLIGVVDRQQSMPILGLARHFLTERLVAGGSSYSGY